MTPRSGSLFTQRHVEFGFFDDFGMEVARKTKFAKKGCVQGRQDSQGDAGGDKWVLNQSFSDPCFDEP